MSAAAIGLVFSIGALGSFAAAFTATTVFEPLNGPTTIAVGMLWGPALLLIAFAPVGNDAILVSVAAAILQGFAHRPGNIQVSYRQAICPPRLQGA